MTSTARLVRNVLLSIAYGDAMGMPTENLTRSQIAERYGDITEFNESPDDVGTFIRHLPAGTVTDDTENAIFLCNMLIDAKGRVDPELFVKYLMDWLDHDERSAVMVGPSTKGAIEAIRHGTPLKESGIWGTTNGASMKIAPIGLISPVADMEGLIRNVSAICMPTHNTQVAIQGACIVAAAVSYMFDNQDIDWNEYYGLVHQAGALSSNLGNPLPTPDILRRIDYGRHIADSADEDEFRDQLYGFMGTGLETIETVPAAITIVYRYRANLRLCVRTCAGIGGDTDTLGAICGGICGGYDCNLTDDEIDTLQGVNAIDFGGTAEGMSSIVDSARAPRA
ncbi:MAG: ADP-ribosylglycohydrolase family protein [Bifidobacterium sp.]|uniref:ADP-ribosylglycohydrolase family protein n=1 Tax=Bifidobacterium sp. TaxID=41200 RepID=UPI0039E97F06